MGKTDGMSYPGEGNCYPQKLGDEGNLQDPKYQNDVKPGWIRGPDATGKPGFQTARGGATGGGSGIGGGPSFTAGADSGPGRLQKRTKGVK